ncbi:HAD family hydrolase [Saccharothrix australiensis]|uniref:Beta-phosphoglucomutase-like phosphatase (HAD superfamily) n=1 Tax=Saccharothrix australiensis TaxID=2072 RepID=A0A495VRQ4_9PSEU|nr:HAD hydrolase-like protein [Saccharothrix australiensis]RKT52031.1 beta-phosphoglucomutase-like phosphatase (HAD superfamily) [Saccharothrix australiensis]
MTTDNTPVDDPEALRHILATTDALLLDFDGPVCSIFANVPAHHVAGQLRRVLAEAGHTELPAEVEKTADPFDVLIHAATLGSDQAHHVESSLRAHEVEAATTAEPTPGAHDLIRTWHATGRKLAIVSNNSQAAVNTYLHQHELNPFVHFVSARTDPNPALLKPSPHLIGQASAALTTPPPKCTLIGDSLTDLRATRAARTRAIGYANKPGKADLFTAEHPAAITTSMVPLGLAARSR